MGRVARYKKIKKCDPYSKENGGRLVLDRVGVWGFGDNGRKAKKRSKTAEKLRLLRKKRESSASATTSSSSNKKQQRWGGDDFDAPPVAGDDFDLADLLGTLKKDKPIVETTVAATKISVPVTTKTDLATTTTTTSVASKPATTAVHEDEQVQEAKLLKVDKQLQKKESSSSFTVSLGRMEGESKRAYNRRVKAETRQIIKNQKVDNRNPEKKKRKKEFLNNKKKKKQKKGQWTAGNDSDEDNDNNSDDDDHNAPEAKKGGFVTGEQAVAARDIAVKFGEQAERPPEFRQLPRGATKKKAPGSTSMMASSKAHPMSQTRIAAEQEAMEVMRRKVQAQYAVIKSRRRSNRDFHL